jgi:hypothetical protein
VRAPSQNLIVHRRSTLGAIDPASDAANAPRPSDRVTFVPAGWLAAAFRIIRLWLRTGKIGKLGIAGLVWSVTPRKLKLVGAGLAGVALIVVAGALSAVALLVIQLT